MKNTRLLLSKSAQHICLISLLLGPWCAFADDSEYRILVTNDDGIEAAGLAALVSELKKSATVLISAPATQQSGRSMATSKHVIAGDKLGTFVWEKPLKVTKLNKDGVFFGLAVEGTPADAAMFGIKYFQSEDSPIDLVVSGINEGPNLGTARGSGTVGAAFKALEMGIPSVAISSQINKDYGAAARYTAKIIAQIVEKGPLVNSVLSINIPAGEIKGVIATPASVSQSMPYVIETDIKHVSADDQESFLVNIQGRWAPDRVATENSNTYFFSKKNFITLTPLKHDPTDYEALSALRLWDLDQ